jgi:hypothetical protein
MAEAVEDAEAAGGGMQSLQIISEKSADALISFTGEDLLR